MANTVRQAGSRAGRSSPKDDERLARGVRAALTQTYSLALAVRTDGGGGLETVWLDADPIRFDSDAILQVKLKAIGASAPTTDYAYYEKIGQFVRAGSGAGAQVGATIDKVTPVESNAAFDCTIGVDSDSKLFVKFDDGAVAAMDVKVWVEVRRDQ